MNPEITSAVLPTANTPIFYFNVLCPSRGSGIAPDIRGSGGGRGMARRSARTLSSVTATMGQACPRFAFDLHARQARTGLWSAGDPRRELRRQSPALRDDLAAFAREALPLGETRVQQIIYGHPLAPMWRCACQAPMRTCCVDLADEALAVLEPTRRSSQAHRIDWRERDVTTPASLCPRSGRRALASPGPMSRRRWRSPRTVSRLENLREGERDIPILLRTPRDGTEADRLLDQSRPCAAVGAYIPLDQILDWFEVQARDVRHPTPRPGAHDLRPRLHHAGVLAE